MGRTFITLRRLVDLVSPGGLLLFAAWALQQEAAIRESFAPFAAYFCFGTLGAAALLSWYHNYARVFCASAAVVLGLLAFTDLIPSTAIMGPAVAFLLPLNFAAFALLRERGIMTLDGAAKVGAIGVQVLAVVVVLVNSGGAELLLRAGERSWSWTWLSWSGMAAFIFGGIILLALVVFRTSNVEAGLLWALAAAFGGINAAGDPGVLYIYGSAAGLALTFAVLEHGYDIAYRDELTGLPGRRAFNEVLAQLHRGYTIAMCDVDHFKKFNDSYGHDAGDRVLKGVASTLLRIRGGGRAFRYGGEEFALIFKRRSAAEVEPYVESIREEIARMSFLLQKPGQVNVTISAGIADHSRLRRSPEAVLEAADAALYRAKESGRDCVKLAAQV
jgi:diguanylate cyclase (GGDEF)-like protein